MPFLVNEMDGVHQNSVCPKRRRTASERLGRPARPLPNLALASPTTFPLATSVKEEKHHSPRARPSSKPTIQIGFCITNTSAAFFIAGLPELIADLISEMVGPHWPFPRSKVQRLSLEPHSEKQWCVSWLLWVRFSLHHRLQINKMLIRHFNL